MVTGAGVRWPLVRPFSVTVDIPEPEINLMTPCNHASLLRIAAAVVALVVTICTVSDSQAQALPPGVDDAQWQRISAQIEAQVDAELVAGEHTQSPDGVTDIHGQVRTAVVTGDYAGLPDQNAGDGTEFGFSIASHGDWLAVGAPGTVLDQTGRSHGAVFVFRRGPGGWVPAQRLQTIAGIRGARCGHSVALHMPHLMIGCPAYSLSEQSVGNGAVAQWKFNTNTESFNFVAITNVFTTGLPANCGSSLALTRNYLASGCPSADGGAGRVTLVRRNADNDSFHESSAVTERVFRGDGLGSQAFGTAVALYEPSQFEPLAPNVRLAVGAPDTIYDGSHRPRGTVRLFHRAVDTATWNANAILRLSPLGTDGNESARFGAALAMNRTQLVAGAPNNRWGALTVVPGPGTTHRYELLSIGGWTHREDGSGVNVPAGPHAAMRFGTAVALGYDNLIAVSAPGTHGETTTGAHADDVGLVELRRTANHEWTVFHYSGEIRPAAINAALIRAGGRFGTALEFNTPNRYLAVGYPYSGTTLQTRPRGSVWIYQPDLIFADGFQP